MATVLYVDDEAPIRRAVSTWLGRKGHFVHEAGTLDEARAVLETHVEALDGVFIDLWLGAESGIELFKWLEARHPTLAERVAFVTGDLFDSPEVGREFARPVFAKPFELKELEAQVVKWAAGRP